MLAEDNIPEASTCIIDGDHTLALPSLADSGDPSSTLGLPSPLRTTVGNACFRRLGNAVVTTVSAATTSGTWMSSSALKRKYNVHITQTLIIIVNLYVGLYARKLHLELWIYITVHQTKVSILTTNLAACVCVCVFVCAQNFTNFCPTLLFRLQTSRKFCSHSKIPIRCLWTAFCVPLSLIFYDKRWFRMQIVTVRRSRFAALWQIINSRNPFSRRGWMARGQRENVVGPTLRNATITVQTPCREQYFFFYCLRLTRLTFNKS